jgi:hypothetical protein
LNVAVKTATHKDDLSWRASVNNLGHDFDLNLSLI